MNSTKCSQFTVYNMKTFCLALILFLPLTGMSQSLNWTNDSLDIQTKTSTEKHEASFEYKNTSKKTITFINIKASCGCILVEKPEKVEPGESGKIIFKAPIPYGGGSYIKSISVDTDETKEVEYKLTFKVTNTDPYVPRKVKAPNKTPETKTSPVKPYTPPKGYTRPEKMTARTILVEKLMAKQTLARKKAYHLQEECPFLPLPIDKKLFHDYNGLRIYTCCEQCLILVKESPQHAIIKLAEKTQTPLEIQAIK